MPFSYQAFRNMSWTFVKTSHCEKGETDMARALSPSSSNHKADDRENIRRDAAVGLGRKRGNIWGTLRGPEGSLQGFRVPSNPCKLLYFRSLLELLLTDEQLPKVKARRELKELIYA